MVKKVTSTKRDLEKAKQSKREEKQKKKEERLNNGSRSFEEMLAYVDENGVLHSTPQEKPREEIDASEIAVSVSKQEAMEAPLPLSGRIDHFNESRGYGFVKDAENGEKYFFHISSAPEDIAEGDMVTFEIERGTRGMNAVRISIINKVNK